MAKVTLTVEDREDAGGIRGIRVSISSDPKFPLDETENTVAQNWGQSILTEILANTEDVREVTDTDTTLN